MRLVITHDGVDTEFVEPGADGPYDWLGKVGTLLLAAHAGHLDIGAAESANVSFELNNISRQAADLLGRPLRAVATIYDDDGELFFTGLVQQLSYGAVLAGTIEA